MSEYDDLIEGYEPSVLATEDPGPLTDEEFQRAMELAPAAGQTVGYLEEPEPPAELRALKSNEIPEPGVHYVIASGIPKPVVHFHPMSEEAYVSSQSLADDTLRADRARRYLQLRYRGFLAGEISSL